MSVKVAVRVRPFNRREEVLGSKCCVEMNGSTTVIGGKSFVYDYSFWSHDGFVTNAEGIFEGVSDKYADQQRVFRDIGVEMLANAWEGYNCCLFAYGQTGSGKSYSMIGYGPNKGLIPIICENIFKKMGEDMRISYEVTVSMMEIYNENIRDLLGREKSNLKICEHKQLGVYVDGLKKYRVHSYLEIQTRINEGSNNRSIASTLMNESSSRSHTIVSINFIQNDKGKIKYSTINLVDLAGSQCVGKTGSGGDRLKEAGKINQSLSTLGRVIEIVAECSQSSKQTHIPYRDSKLTYILRNALGGNSRTAMICAISPSSDNFQESISTLRYATRAKHIKNKAVVNESDIDKLIRMLRQENQDLKRQLQEAKGREAKDLTSTSALSLGLDILQGANEPEEENLLEDIQEKEVLPLKQPPVYITNVSEDELLSFRIKYSCEKLIVGSKLGNPKPDMVLASLGILPHHARIYTDGETVYLQACEEEASNYLYLNGQQVCTRMELHHNDRIIFGIGCVFLVRDSRNKEMMEVDYQFALNEMQQANLDFSRMDISREEDDIEGLLNEKIREVVEQSQMESQRLKEELERQTKQSMRLQEEKDRISYELAETQVKASRIEELEQALDALNCKKLKSSQQREQLELETLICNNENIIIKCRQNWSKRRPQLLRKEKSMLVNALRELVLKVQEFKLVGQSMGRMIYCQLVVPYRYMDDKIALSVKIMNAEEKRSYYWTVEKFDNRYHIAKELFEENNFQALSLQQDPFWDPPEYYPFAHAYLTLQSIFYSISFRGHLSLVAGGIKIGTIQAVLYRTDAEGVKEYSVETEQHRIKIVDPLQEDYSEIYFWLELKCITVEVSMPETFKVEYFLKEKFSSGVVEKKEIGSFCYRRLHLLRDLYESQLIQIMQRPIDIEFQIIPPFDSASFDPPTAEKSQQEEETQKPSIACVSKGTSPFAKTSLVSSGQAIYENDAVTSQFRSEKPLAKPPSKPLPQKDARKNVKKSFRESISQFFSGEKKK